MEGDSAIYPDGTEAIDDSIRKAVSHLKVRSEKDEDYLRITFIMVRLLQNILSYPKDERYRTLRQTAPVLAEPGGAEVLLCAGFANDPRAPKEFLTCPLSADPNRVQAVKLCLLEARRKYDSVEALEVPVTSLTFGERLGKGQFGEVYHGSWDGVPVAIKTLRPNCDPHIIRHFHREASLMKCLQHANVTSLHAVCLMVKPPILAMELLVTPFMNHLHEGRCSTVQSQVSRVIEVALGMEYVHSKNIIHCDLAARNILVDRRGNLRICDFGLARICESPECTVTSKEFMFPVRWTAPDVLATGHIAKHSDIWSFGVIFYEFVTAGSTPYGDFTNSETRRKVKEGYRLPCPVDCPEGAHAVMTKCWHTSPAARPTFTALLAELRKLKLKYPDEVGRPSLEGSASSISLLSGRSLSSSSSDTSSSSKSGKSKKDAKVKKKMSFAKSDQAKVEVDQLVRLYTLFVTPFQTYTILELKKKHKASDLVAMAVKHLGKTGSESHYSLVEVKLNLSGEFDSRFIASHESPLMIKATWNSPGKFLLCHCAVGDAKILQAINGFLKMPEHADKVSGKTRGYLIKFDEYIDGAKTVGRRKRVNWTRFWAVLDGSTLLFYKEEEDEESGEEPVAHIALHNAQALPALDFSKKRDVIRILSPNENTHLLHVSSKLDVLRWLESFSSAQSAEPSSLLDKFGDGEISQSGYLSVTRSSLPVNESEIPEEMGRQWFVLRGRQLHYFSRGTRLEALDFTTCTGVSVMNPVTNPALTSSAGGTPRALSRMEAEDEEQEKLLLFGIRVDTPSSRLFLQPDTPGDLDAWVEALDKVLLKMGKSELMIALEGEGGGGNGGDSDSGVFGMAPDVHRLSEVLEEDDALEESLGEQRNGGGGGSGDGKLKPIGAVGGPARYSIRHRQKGFVAMGRLNNSGVDETAYYPELAMDTSSGPSSPSPIKPVSPKHLAAPASPFGPGGDVPPKVPSSPRPSPKPSPAPQRSALGAGGSDSGALSQSGLKSPPTFELSLPAPVPPPPPLEIRPEAREDSDGMYIVPNPRGTLSESNSVDDDTYEVSSIPRLALRPLVEVDRESSSPALPPRPKVNKATVDGPATAVPAPPPPQPMGASANPADGYPDEHLYEVEGDVRCSPPAAVAASTVKREEVMSAGYSVVPNAQDGDDDDLYSDAVEMSRTAVPKPPAAGAESAAGYVVTAKTFHGQIQKKPEDMDGGNVAKAFCVLPSLPPGTSSKLSPKPPKNLKPLASPKPLRNSPADSPQLRSKPPPPSFPPPADLKLVTAKKPPPPPLEPPPPDTPGYSDEKLLADADDLLDAIDKRGDSVDQDGYEVDLSTLAALRQRNAVAAATGMGVGNSAALPPPPLPEGQEAGQVDDIYSTPEGRETLLVADTGQDELYLNLAQATSGDPGLPPPLPADDALPPLPADDAPPPLPPDKGSAAPVPELQLPLACPGVSVQVAYDDSDQLSPLTANPLYGNSFPNPGPAFAGPTATEPADTAHSGSGKSSGRASPVPPPKPAKKKKSADESAPKEVSHAPPLPVKQTPPLQRSAGTHASPLPHRLSQPRLSGNWQAGGGGSSRNSLSELHQAAAGSPGGSPLPPRLPPKGAAGAGTPPQSLPVVMQAVRPGMPAHPHAQQLQLQQQLQQQQVFLVRPQHPHPGYITSPPGAGAPVGMVHGHLIGMPRPTVLMQDPRHPAFLRQRSMPGAGGGGGGEEGEEEEYMPMGVDQVLQAQQHQLRQPDGDDYTPMTVQRTISTECAGGAGGDEQYDDDYTPMQPPAQGAIGLAAKSLQQQQQQQQQYLLQQQQQQQYLQQQQHAAMMRDRHQQALALQQELQLESGHLCGRTRLLTQARGVPTIQPGTVTMIPVSTAGGIRHVPVMSPPTPGQQQHPAAQYGLLRQHSVDGGLTDMRTAAGLVQRTSLHGAMITAAGAATTVSGTPPMPGHDVVMMSPQRQPVAMGVAGTPPGQYIISPQQQLAQAMHSPQTTTVGQTRSSQSPSQGPGGKVKRQISHEDLAGTGIASRRTSLSQLHPGSEQQQGLPLGWQAHTSEGRKYYYSKALGRTTWSLDEVFKLAAASPADTGVSSAKAAPSTSPTKEPGPGWKEAKNAQGRTYYYNRGTRQTTWRIEDTLPR